MTLLAALQRSKLEFIEFKVTKDSSLTFFLISTPTPLLLLLLLMALLLLLLLLAMLLRCFMLSSSLKYGMDSMEEQMAKIMLNVSEKLAFSLYLSIDALKMEKMPAK